jgi:hypothetical protein
MREKLRQFFATNIGKATAVLLFSLGIYGAWFGLGNVEADRVALTRERVFVCSETGKIFQHTVKIGDTFPLRSPHSGKETGYRAEACYWTRVGQIKTAPTWVLLNQSVGKPGPTFCPDCDRLVTEMNNPPVQGHPAPPTQEEMNSNPRRARAAVEP